MTYNVIIAYLLFFISGFGVLGLHRFYLGKPGSALLWIFSGGFFGLGSIYDLLTLPAQVREANLRLALRTSLDLNPRPSLPRPAARMDDSTKRRESVERIILRAARSSAGIVTPGVVSLEGDIALEEARKALDKMAAQGFAEMRVRESGVVEYVFPEFARDKGGYAI